MPPRSGGMLTSSVNTGRPPFAAVLDDATTPPDLESFTALGRSPALPPPNDYVPTALRRPRHPTLVPARQQNTTLPPRSAGRGRERAAASSPSRGGPAYVQHIPADVEGVVLASFEPRELQIETVEGAV